MNILIKVSGSISAYKICDLVSKLKKEKHAVKIAASESALNFVGAATWEGLSGEEVFSNDFSPNQRMDHIHLNDWAQLVILAPATAQTLDSLSQGVGSGVLTTLFLARKQETPYLIFPAMNPRMWSSLSVQKSVESLKEVANVQVFEPSEGRMACGHIGSGRLNEVEQILDRIYEVIKQTNRLRVLVTFGGTEEKIDGVRSISNFSTGRTGLILCEQLKAEYQVTALGSEASYKNENSLWGVEKLSFKSSNELANRLYQKVSEEHYDLIVHAAAVSDFIPKVHADQKISSDGDLSIEWSRAPKILDKIRDHSKNKKVKIISFKLTYKQSHELVQEKISKQLAGVSDYVIHNELGEIDMDKHAFRIWEKNSRAVQSQGATKSEMAALISKIGRS